MDKLQLLQVAKKVLQFGGGKENKSSDNGHNNTQHNQDRKHTKNKTMRTRSLNIFDEYDNIMRSPNPDPSSLQLGNLRGNSTSVSNLPGNRTSMSVLNRTQSISISTVFKEGSELEDERKEQKRKYHSVKHRSKRPVMSIVDSLNIRPGSLGRKNIYSVQPKSESKTSSSTHQKLTKALRPLHPDSRRSMDKSPAPRGVGGGSTGSSPSSALGDSVETSEDSEDEATSFEQSPKVFTSKQSLVEYFKGLQNPMSQSPVTKQQCRRPHVPSVNVVGAKECRRQHVGAGAGSHHNYQHHNHETVLDRNRNHIDEKRNPCDPAPSHQTSSLRSERNRSVDWESSEPGSASSARNKVIRAKSCLKKPTKHFTVRSDSPPLSSSTTKASSSVASRHHKVISKTELTASSSPSSSTSSSSSSSGTSTPSPSSISSGSSVSVKNDSKSQLMTAGGGGNGTCRTPKATRKLSLKIRGDSVEIQDIVVPKTTSHAKTKLSRQTSGASSIVRGDTFRMKEFDEISVVDNIPNDVDIGAELNVRSSIDKVDEMTRSIFSDEEGSTADNKEKMVEINFY